MLSWNGARLAALSAAAAGAIAGVVPAGDALASSHREAPIISGDPMVDGTDVYAFVSPENPDRVVLIMNYIPAQIAYAGPNWYFLDTAARYNMWVDNDGDAVADGAIRWRFKTNTTNDDTFLNFTGEVSAIADPDINRRQSFDIYWVDAAGLEWKLNTSSLRVVPPNPGPVTMPDYGNVAMGGIHTLSNGWRIWAGPADDPFFVDLGAIFDLVQIRDPGVDGLYGANVHVIAMEIPIEDLTMDGLDAMNTAEPVLGFWSTASRNRTTTLNADGTRTSSGAQVQVSRLGMPLVNEVVIALQDKNRFNASSPSGDVQFLSYVTDPEIAADINALYGFAGADCVETGRTDLVAVFLTGLAGLNQPAGVVASEQLRLNVSIAPVTEGDAGFSAMGVIGGDLGGFPNGRRLQDDVVDIAEQVACGLLVGSTFSGALTDNVDSNDEPFQGTFPFVAFAHSGY